MNEIFTRRSVRKYADKPVEKEKVEKLLRRAMQAPSATNQQLDRGAVWMGAGLGDERDRNIIKIFDLPENVKPFAVVSIGYPAEENANKFVERYDESRVHYNKY